MKTVSYTHLDVYKRQDPGTAAILKGMAAAIKDEDFTVTVDEENELLRIEAKDITSTNILVLSENLTTDTVTTIITFGTVNTGDILLPEGVITNIVKADAGLLSVVNLCAYIAGRDEETDTEFRQSYADKIFNRSSICLLYTSRDCGYAEGQRGHQPCCHG